MTKKAITTFEYTDDLTASLSREGDVETVTFALDGTSCRMDLYKKNAKALRDALKS
ncbi:MAG: Lsr2 family protein [Propionibacteriales bacterium]|nr:Lsr2 family protein [Propionibacteriales bacterium]